MRRRGPCESNATSMPERRPAIDDQAPERGHQPQVVEDHGPDVEDELLGGLQRGLDHRAQRGQLATQARIAATGQPLHDLRLERDVGEALRRAIVHVAGDVLAQLLLGPQQRAPVALRPAAGAARDGVRDGRPWRRAGDRRRCERTGPWSAPGQHLVDRLEPVPEARQRPCLALKHLLLGLEQDRTPAQDQQLGAGLAQLGGIRTRIELHGGDAVLRLGATGFVPLGLRHRLRRQERQLIELLVERGDVGGQHHPDAGDLGLGRGSGGCLGGRCRRQPPGIGLDDQSSGIRIQPCFMA